MKNVVALTFAVALIFCCSSLMAQDAASQASPSDGAVAVNDCCGSAVMTRGCKSRCRLFNRKNRCCDPCEVEVVEEVCCDDPCARKCKLFGKMFQRRNNCCEAEVTAETCCDDPCKPRRKRCSLGKRRSAACCS